MPLEAFSRQRLHDPTARYPTIISPRGGTHEDFFTRMAFLALIASFGLMTALSAAPKTGGESSIPKTGFIAAILSDFDGVGKKLEDLAGAIPADKYSWSPAKGVRSVGEVYKHVAGAKLLFHGFPGGKAPANAMPDQRIQLPAKTRLSRS